ncbi:MAG: hypothetical protein J5654_02185 [Victivallales bacterium]|nr:hypothetical protein [Victivallales bacterium]
MSFISDLLAKFHRTATANKPMGTDYMQNDTGAPTTRPNKNVYDEARKVPIPDWAQGLNNTDLAQQLRSHSVCQYAPNFGWKRIMTTVVGPDGNLLPEYDGIAGDCGAVKSFGMKVAQRDGRTMPYKYVDVNMAFRCCCGNPKKCPFYLQATGEADTVNKKLR